MTEVGVYLYYKREIEEENVRSKHMECRLISETHQILYRKIPRKKCRLHDAESLMKLLHKYLITPTNKIE